MELKLLTVVLDAHCSSYESRAHRRACSAVETTEIMVAGYCSLMNINEQNSFCCFVQKNTLDGTKLAVKHHNVRPRKANDSCRNLQSTKLGSAMKKSLVTDSAEWCFSVYSASTRI